MECDHVQQALAVSPREWSDAERAQVESHLHVCPACAAVARLYTEQEQMLSALPRPGMSLARQQMVLAQARRDVDRRQLRTRLSNVMRATAGVLAFGFLIAMLVFLLRTTAPIGPTAALTGKHAPIPTIAPLALQPPTPAPPPTVILPNGQGATVTPITPSPLYATEEAARRATETASQATAVARATVTPFPTAEPVTVQVGQPVIAFARRDGLSFQVRLTKDTFMMGESGQAEITLRNDSQEAIFVNTSIEPVLLDEQGQQPNPWPWTAMSFPDMRSWQARLQPGQALTQTRTFHIPLIESAAGHTYTLWAETSFSRSSPGLPEQADNLWMRLEAGPISLHSIPPDPARQLMAQLQADLTGWKLRVTDAAGRLPSGPLWGEFEALYANAATAGPLQNILDGTWSGNWGDTRQLTNTRQIAMRAWVAAPGYVTALAQIGSDDTFGNPTRPMSQSYASLAAAQAALDFPLYQPRQLPTGASLDEVKVETAHYDQQRRVNVSQMYRLPDNAGLELIQMVTTENYASAGWGEARFAPEAQLVTVGQVSGIVIQHLGWWVLDWKVGDVGFELRAPARTLSLEELVQIAARVQSPG